MPLRTPLNLSLPVFFTTLRTEYHVKRPRNQRTKRGLVTPIKADPDMPEDGGNMGVGTPLSENNVKIEYEDCQKVLKITACT